MRGLAASSAFQTRRRQERAPLCNLPHRKVNEKIVRFCGRRDGSEMTAFLVDCHPNAEAMRSIDVRAAPRQAT